MQISAGGGTIITDPRHPLEIIYEEAVDEVRSGKGVRHGGEAIEFTMQPWRQIADIHGPRFLTGQAQKKIMEAVTRYDGEQIDFPAYKREVLGAMNYLAMALLHEGQEV